MRKKNIKIVQVFEKYPLFYQLYIPLVIQSLQKKNELEVKIVAFKGNANKESSISILPHHYVRTLKEKLDYLLYPKLPKLNYLELLCIQNSIDIIHIQHSFLFSKVFGLLKMPKNKRSKIVITLRGGDTYIKPWLGKRWIDFYKNEGQKIDAFITVSNHQKEYLQKWGVSEDKIYVIPVSFGNKTNAQPKYPSIDRIKIISAHRMCWEKNIEGNLRVIKLLKEKGYSVQYDIFGNGPDKGQVFYLIDKYNLEEEVTYYGKIENELFKSKLIDYDFFLQLSHSEAFGASVIEAQSKGVPCIVSNSGGLPEAININKSGFCVKPYNIDEAVNYIVDLYLNPDKYFSFSKEAIRNSNENFTVEIEVKKLMNLYNSLISN